MHLDRGRWQILRGDLNGRQWKFARIVHLGVSGSDLAGEWLDAGRSDNNSLYRVQVQRSPIIVGNITKRKCSGAESIMDVCNINV